MSLNFVPHVLANDCRDRFTALRRMAHSEFLKFSAAWAAASGSGSIPVMRAESDLCAIISAISPLPVPTSRISPEGHTSVHAPSSTPSVPTFMAQRSCHTVKCLKRKYGFPSYRLSP